MNIYECEKKAQAIGYDSATFDLVGPTGVLQARWLDAYMGLIKVDGKEGFIMSRDVADMPEISCENLMAPTAEDKD